MSVMFSQEKPSLLPQRLYFASLWCDNELLVPSDWSVRGGGGLGKDCCLTRQQLLEKKRDLFLFGCWPPSLSAPTSGDSLRSSSLHSSAYPFLPLSLPAQ